LVSDELWAIVEPLIPGFTPRRQGGGTAPVDDRAVFTAIVYVVTSGSAWRQLPSCFGVDFRTAHRRFTTWTRAWLWREISRAMLDELSGHPEIDWWRAIVDAATARAKSAAG
jgi:transposase